MKTNMYTMLLLAFFAGSSLTALANGASTWTGDGDGWRWEDPDNWEYDQVPDEYDNVLIGGDAYVQVTEPGAECMSIRLDDDATLFIRSEGGLTVAYSYEEGIDMNDYSTLVIWGSLEIHHTGEDDYTGNGIEMNNDTRVLNRGELSIHHVDMEGDGIDMEDDAVFVNRGSLYISEIDNEGIEMDNDAIFRNRGLLEIMYVDSDAIDQDDDDTEFLNDGTINISYIDSEGIEVDDGIFTNTQNGEINIGFVFSDMIYMQSDGTFENYGEINLLPVPPDFSVESAPELEEGPDPAEAPDPEVAADAEIELYGAIYAEDYGRFVNYNLVDIDFFFNLGSPEEPEPQQIEYYLVYGSLVTVYDGMIENKDCAEINIDGPFPIYNEGQLSNEGTIDLSIDNIPISPEEGPGPLFGDHVNYGYFYNDGDILSDYPFFIGPNPIDEEWTKSSIGGEGENDSFSLGCDITITTSSRQGHRATTDNVAFLNQPLCGNSMLTARLDGVSNGFGGIMIRDGEGGGNNGGPANVPSESSPKMFMIASKNIDVIYHGTRYNEGDQLSYTPFFTPHDNWLRVERIGNYIRAYHSSDGSFWSLFHQVYLELGECAQVGLFATSQNGAPAMAAFSHVEVSGSEQYFSVPDVPTAEAPAIQQRATVWPTPAQSQFTVEFEQATQVAGTAILRNELGQAIGQRKLEPGTWQLQWDANTLPGGLYLLEVQTEDGYREVLKVLKQ
ncbi:hypothetical protein [Phaeodactylibacter sp.]|uniref:hypothetical protein n=1 Tax=Phaeodactylibacter sp. TaxID=1940289 RepID=UPI0025F0F196|nr:hypothetical protein [Phaeodactylibacter sp.]MCI4651237.1 hypothetical protein [Phaeodactylibacter sp.]MCI5094606.1 hypothetical protein [Phaeodactylibacter sp.]